MIVNIVGGGASGIIAAINAAKNGHEVNIFEKMKNIGKKILATGNGKCNYTNKKMDETFFYCKNKELIKNSLQIFDDKSTISFFKSIGVYPREIDGRIYPITENSLSIVKSLENELNRLNIKIYTKTKIFKIDILKNKFILNDKYESDILIIAAGGKSYPALGSDGSINSELIKLGHTFKTQRPALVQLISNDYFLPQLKGVRVKGNASLFDHKNIKIIEKNGEILFTDYGLSGIPSMQISRFIKPEKNYIIKIDLAQNIDKDEINNYLINQTRLNPNLKISDSLIGIIHFKLINIILQINNIHNIPLNQLKRSDRNKIINSIKNFNININGTKGWKESQVTTGGINLNEINEINFESKKIKNLYICGEILDIDGDCGGYNLQWAWTSGYIVGNNIMRRDKNDTN
ncbi:aminoacetone oxidase family FAD-binding enzyme [Oceanotoga sp. DSM 15011]|jgi:hypothetical protein|uniref:NAD(P)/FAD-dependent oxidoreductase n=1 Tax=unclassified Oceanotoga TaxID=2618448 RepID=UPI0021F3EDD9|nr:MULTISPECIES: aminoacetone oxidase family FAD-binding enzyme [unclassified Oceanotoga]MDN5342800.1 hypothetical protein [Oceanotoga sp.]UYO99634.1 aminoacetone oxidase family FAD-binding enzyme [Oceanotoga sp. DSM 15011]